MTAQQHFNQAFEHFAKAIQVYMKQEDFAVERAAKAYVALHHLSSLAEEKEGYGDLFSETYIPLHRRIVQMPVTDVREAYELLDLMIYNQSEGLCLGGTHIQGCADYRQLLNLYQLQGYLLSEKDK